MFCLYHHLDSIHKMVFNFLCKRIEKFGENQSYLLLLMNAAIFLAASYDLKGY